MHIITRKRLIDFCQRHPDCARSIEAWYKIVKFAKFNNFVELRMTFPGADRVGKLTVFNIGGNKARLIAAIHYNTGKLYIRHVLTHREYDSGKWKEE